MNSTWLIEAIEEELNGESLSVFLHRKMAAGWTLRTIRDDLEQRTGWAVSIQSISRWTRGMGYAKSQAAEEAWTHGLIAQSILDEKKSRRRQRPFLNVVEGNQR